MMDRGFFKTEMIIKLLESMSINFIMPAVRNERIKRMLNEFAKGEFKEGYDLIYELTNHIYWHVPAFRSINFARHIFASFQKP